MTVKSYANSVILILFAISDNLSAENSKLSADSWNRGNHLLGCVDKGSVDLQVVVQSRGLKIKTFRLADLAVQKLSGRRA